MRLVQLGDEKWVSGSQESPRGGGRVVAQGRGRPDRCASPESERVVRRRARRGRTRVVPAVRFTRKRAGEIELSQHPHRVCHVTVLEGADWSRMGAGVANWSNRGRDWLRMGVWKHCHRRPRPAGGTPARHIIASTSARRKARSLGEGGGWASTQSCRVGGALLGRGHRLEAVVLIPWLPFALWTPWMAPVGLSLAGYIMHNLRI